MRKIDDLIDNHKAANRLIVPGERKEFLSDVNDWLKMVVISEDCNPEKEALIKTIERFNIPLWPLEAFAKSMIYDINNDGFESLESFLSYAQGASVAPASIFVHLAGLTSEDGYYNNPSFDVREAATPCAIFSYLVHIVRDFQKDQFNNLNYLADDLIRKYGLSRHDLKKLAQGAPVTDGFRDLIREYCTLADDYRKKTRDVIDRIGPAMEPRYRLSLEIIFSLYQMVFERINPEIGNFTTYELNPTPEETRERVWETILNFSV
jgi:phytoene/squalene synthetase